MNVKIVIIGDGVVTGAGTHSMGDAVSLEATPSSFSHFLRGEEVITTNPYAFEATDSDVEISAVFIVTLEAYLKASVGFNIPDAALMKIRINREWNAGQDIAFTDIKVRELSYADLLMWVVNIPSQIQGAKETDMYWGHQEANVSFTPSDKSRLQRSANAIYRKYGEPVSDPSVKLMSLNGTKANVTARY